MKATGSDRIHKSCIHARRILYSASMISKVIWNKPPRQPSARPTYRIYDAGGIDWAVGSNTFALLMYFDSRLRNQYVCRRVGQQHKSCWTGRADRPQFPPNPQQAGKPTTIHSLPVLLYTKPLLTLRSEVDLHAIVLTACQW